MVSVTMETGVQFVFKAQKTDDCGPISKLSPLKEILCIGTVKVYFAEVPTL